MFSRKPDGPEMAARGDQPSFSVLGADIVITGDIHAAADLHVDGKIEGDLTCAALVQGEGSEVLGAIRADSARLAGTVRGSIEAGQLTVLKTARIHGDVAYDALIIEQGAQVEGRFSHRTAAAPVVAGEDEAARISLVS